MPKAHPLPHPHTARHADGSYDWDQLKAATDQIYADGKAGLLTVDHIMYEVKDGKRYFVSVMTEV